MKSIKDLNYYKNNCEEDYIKTPISVLRYITELEQALQLQQTGVSGSINELLSKFENGLELYRNNAVFANCIENLVRGEDIYKIFEQIIIMQSNTQEKLTELITSGVLRQEIIVSKEKYDELASGL
jgi:predicted transcriptional regulator